ncbi:hypothetical protein Tco_1068138 [Tanacetum coccineum]|uniref:Uncharacterized protein n=1 Tax=Tanacetum coccineum TaxID=301880 RepID=A0ABQ5HF10_9ASTR
MYKIANTKLPNNECSSDFSFLLLDVMHYEMCLCKLLLLAKMGSELCFQVFVVENATCLLTIPPYSGIIFKCVDEHMTVHRHCLFLHMNGTFEEVQEIVRIAIRENTRGAHEPIRYGDVASREGLRSISSIGVIGKRSSEGGAAPLSLGRMAHGLLAGYPHVRLGVRFKDDGLLSRSGGRFIPYDLLSSNLCPIDLPPSSFLSTMLPSLFGASSISTTISFYLRTLKDAACEIVWRFSLCLCLLRSLRRLFEVDARFVSGVFSGVLAVKMEVVIGGSLLALGPGKV